MQRNAAAEENQDEEDKRISSISQDSLFESEDVVNAKIREAMTARQSDADLKTIDFSKRSVGFSN